MGERGEELMEGEWVLPSPSSLGPAVLSLSHKRLPSGRPRVSFPTDMSDGDDNDRGLTRREWVGIVSAPAIAAALGSTLLTGEAAAVDTLQQPRRTDSDEANLVGARVFNVRDFGARGDGATLDTGAVQAAIDAATADRGGTVLVPAGDFVVGTIELKSYVTLHVAAGGRLLGSPDPAHYRAGNGIPP